MKLSPQAEAQCSDIPLTAADFSRKGIQPMKKFFTPKVKFILAAAMTLAIVHSAL